MSDSSIWLSEQEASEVLRVDAHVLELLREGGFLKPGSHWRSSTDPAQKPWKPKVFYLINGCKEVIELCKDNESSLYEKAA